MMTPVKSREILVNYLNENDVLTVDQLHKFEADQDLFFGPNMNSLDYVLSLRDVGIVAFNPHTRTISILARS